MLKLQSLNVAYGKAQVLRDLSLHVAAGEILCLLGRNGAGKTTTKIGRASCRERV